ncbi:hypothetical protein K438DRAFT_184618 [Mycena galopus ATCC 62051]|nr:hypothetical protein K438DRAFT_184618 [Mycena galopus ATCC 62051]
MPLQTRNLISFFHQSTESGSLEIEPHTLTFAPDKPPDGWIRHLHPEGAHYFCHPERRIFTDINICDEKNLQSINQVVDQIMEEIRSSGNEKADSLIDIVIDIVPTEPEAEERWWGYYLVNHSEQCPFWVHRMSAHYLTAWSYIQGPIEKEQLRHEMEYQYYRHCGMFPNSLGLTQRHIDKLKTTHTLHRR